MSRSRWIVVAAALLAAAILAAVVFGRPTTTPPALGGHPAGPGAGPADVFLTSFNDAFLMQSNGTGYYRLSTTGGFASFFKQAELIEMMEDAYVRSGDPAYRTMIGVLYKGLVAHHGSGSAWLIESNDDLMWATIMCLRAYRITGDRTYLLQGKSTFDGTYARSWSPALGGGLWNSARRLSKNTSVTAPAAIAGCLLYRSLRDPSYLAKAKALYGWLHRTLCDPTTGAVYDHVSPLRGGAGGVALDRTTWTYNQGGLIGAADLLYGITSDRRYYEDALKTLRYTKDHLTVGGILRSEVAVNSPSDASAGGFKGMFVRWAATFIADDHVPGFTPWFEQNATAVRSHVNAAGLMNEDWSAQTGTGTLSAFSCSSAVVLLQWYPPAPQPTVSASSRP